jgi:hypothetical protein
MQSRHEMVTVFDRWVQDALRERYEPALREPLPEMLLRILDAVDAQPAPLRTPR